MKNRKYNLISGPKKTVTDYVEALTNEDLNLVYNTSFVYDLKLPGLFKKLRSEMQKRDISAVPVLF